MSDVNEPPPRDGSDDRLSPPPDRPRSREGRRHRSRSYSPDRRRVRSRSRSPPSRRYRDRSYSPSPPSGRRYRDDRYRPDDYRYNYRDPRDAPPRDYRYGPPPPRGPPRGPRRGGGGGRRRRDEGPPGVSLLVRNIAPSTTSQDLHMAFSRIGELRDVYIPRDYHSQQPKGFAFIEYATTAQAADAREEMDRFVIKGKELEVVFAQERRKTPDEMRGRVVNQQNRGGDRPSLERSSSFERHKQREKDERRERDGEREQQPPEGEKEKTD